MPVVEHTSTRWVIETASEKTGREYSDGYVHLRVTPEGYEVVARQQPALAVVSAQYLVLYFSKSPSELIRKEGTRVYADRRLVVTKFGQRSPDYIFLEKR